VPHPESPLPEYTVRVSPRARRVRLRVDARGLTVVVPRGFDTRRVDAIVRERRAWAERALERMSARAEDLAALRSQPLPSHVDLPVTGERLPVTYRETGASGVRAIETRDGTLSLSGAVHDREACREALRRWLGRAATARLVPMTVALAREGGLRHDRVEVRAQRRRWGSCSSAGVIRLNRALVLMPPELARYVIVHELVHTVRLDHSPAFWAELERRQPHARALARRMRDAWRLLPGWAQDEE
jgi:predicted metal-dependent hydrolase